MENLILTISLALGVAVYSLIAKWYVMPVLDKHSPDKALPPLILLHCFRYQGLAFLIPGVVARNIAPSFAVPTAYGDLLTALLAIGAVIALRSKWKRAIMLVWIFNIVGSLDLVHALPQGLLNARAGQFGGAYYIPVLIVPALLVSHFLIFRILMKQVRGQ